MEGSTMAKWSKGKTKRSGLHKMFSSAYINTGRNIDTGRARAIQALGGPGGTVLYRDRVNSNGVVKRLKDGTLESFGHYLEVPKERSINLQEVNRWMPVKPQEVIPPKGYQIKEKVDIAPPRIRVFQKWTAERTGHGHVEWKSVLVEETIWIRLTMWFAGDRAFFIEDDTMYQTRRMSVLYSSSRAREIFHQTPRIIWNEMMKLSDVVKPPPT
jgi:hypothetical protein